MLQSVHGALTAAADVQSIELNAVLTKADGTRIDFGRVCYHHRNPLIRMGGNIAIRIHRRYLRWKHNV